MHGLQECLYIIVGAIRIYAQRGEDAAKRGGWRLCIKWSWKLHCWSWKINENSWNCVFEFLWGTLLYSNQKVIFYICFWFLVNPVVPGPKALLVASQTADPGIMSSIPACSHTFHGDGLWNNFYCHSPPSTDPTRVVVSYKRKYVHKVLGNRLVKLAQEKIQW